MGYTITADYEMLDLLRIENLVIKYLDSNKVKIAKTDEFEEYLLTKGISINELTYEQLQQEIEEFHASDDWLDMVMESRYPATNTHHILQEKNISEEKLELFLDLEIPGVTVSLLHELNTNIISLTACGMDLSESIELSYYLFDGVSPIIANDVYYVNDKLKELLVFCREKVKQHGYVNFYDIKNKWEEIK